MKTFAANSPKHGKKLLIIEDDQLIADVYKRHFEAACFEVQIEMNGAEGYYQIYELRPDAVLLDLLLPGMDGASIIRKFRAQKEFAALPIIVFTNAYVSDIGREATSAGATRVFDKATVTPQEIVKAVVDALGRNGKTPGGPKPKDLEAPEGRAMLSVSEEPPYHGEAAEPDKGSLGVAEEQPSLSDAAPTDELEEELALQAAARREFFRKISIHIDTMRDIVCLLKVDAGSLPKPETFLEMARIAHTISGHAAIVGLHHMAHLTAALEAFALELAECPSRFGVPKRYTLAKVIDMIARLAACGSSCQPKEFGFFHVLVVDDDEIARTMISKTLVRANLVYVATGRPEAALELLRENKFDLVILDVDMEGMSGFDICKALRKMDQHRHCPVIFVTVLSDFHSKMVSLQSGGQDFIIKPFDPTELALKTLIYMIGAQIGPEIIPQVSQVEPKVKDELSEGTVEIME